MQYPKDTGVCYVEGVLTLTQANALLAQILSFRSFSTKIERLICLYQDGVAQDVDQLWVLEICLFTMARLKQLAEEDFSNEHFS